MKRSVALVLCTILTAQCAARAVPPQPAPSPSVAEATMAAASRIPAGSRVNLTLNDGRRLKVVLLGVEGEDLLVRERTRIPEPPFRLDAARVAYLELDAGRTGVGKMIAIGASIGAGATLAFLALLAAALDD